MGPNPRARGQSGSAAEDPGLDVFRLPEEASQQMMSLKGVIQLIGSSTSPRSNLMRFSFGFHRDKCRHQALYFFCSRLTDVRRLIFDNKVKIDERIKS